MHTQHSKEIEGILALLVDAEQRLAIANQQLSIAERVNRDVERLASNGGSHYRILQVIRG